MRVLRHAPPAGSEVCLTTTRYGTIQRVKDLALILDNTPGRTSLGRTPKADRENPRPAPRPRSAKFTKNIVNKLENSESFDLWKVARYANWSGLPVSVIMLVQELAAHLRDGKIDLAKEIAAGATVLCKHVVDDAERLSGIEPGPGSDKTTSERDQLLKLCKNKDPEDPKEDSKRDKLVLIADELFRRYPKSALSAKRGEWKRTGESSTNSAALT